MTELLLPVVGYEGRVGNLRWGTPTENMLDRVRNGLEHNSAKTHCIRKHEFTPENTRIVKGRWRQCKRCEKIWAQKRREKVA